MSSQPAPGTLLGPNHFLKILLSVSLIPSNLEKCPSSVTCFLSQHRALCKWFVPLIHPLLHFPLQHMVPSRGHPVKRGRGVILDPKVRLAIFSCSSPVTPRKQHSVCRDSQHWAAQGHGHPTMELAPSRSQPKHHPGLVSLTLACPCSWGSHAQGQTWSSHSFR